MAQSLHDAGQRDRVTGNLGAGRLDRDGLPIGVQLYGNFCREDLLLQIVAQIEQARPDWFGSMPPVHVSRSQTF